MKRASNRFWMTALLIACVGGVIYFAFLGSSGFSMSEGHRVVPGWTMLRRGDFFLPHMFEQAYLRKPPGMPWAIALFSYLFGFSEFAARSVSATSMILAAIASAWFARRWFGGAAGLVAGLAHVLLPWMWESGRAAEIEALNNLGTVLAAWGLTDLLRSRGDNRFAVIAVAAFGLFLAAIAKGPASLPVIAAVPVAASLVQRDFSPLRSTAFWSAIVVGVVAIGVIGMLMMRRVRAEHDTIVTQGVSEFLWSASRAPQILTLPFVFIFSAMPLSLAMIPCLFSEAESLERTRIARTLSLTIVLAVVIYAAAGVSNPRYTLPAAAVLSPLVGCAWQIWRSQASAGPRRIITLARFMHATAIPVAILLFFGALVYIAVGERVRAESSGREVGRELGSRLENGATVLANDMIEARPEVLLYAQLEAEKRGKYLDVRWIPNLLHVNAAPSPSGVPLYLLLRSDSGSDEVKAMANVGTLQKYTSTQHSLQVGSVNRPFRAVLYRAK